MAEGSRPAGDRKLRGLAEPAPSRPIGAYFLEALQKRGTTLWPAVGTETGPLSSGVIGHRKQAGGPSDLALAAGWLNPTAGRKFSCIALTSTK